MVLRFLLGALQAVTALASPAQAQQAVAPEAAPAAWVVYAERVNAQVTAKLGSDDEVAVRLRTYVDGLRSAPEAAPPSVALRLWLTPAGVVERIAFAPFAEPSANTDLETLLVGMAVGAPPPQGMLQPLRLAIDVAPASPPASAAAPAASGTGQAPAANR